MTALEEPAGNEGIKARVSAIKIVAQWMETGDFPDRQLSFVAPVCRGFAMDLVYTTLRNVRLLDSIVSDYITKQPNHTVMAAILLGACQIFKLENMAEHAAVHATVEALKKAGEPNSAGFVNAVLRNLLRARDVIEINMKVLPLAIRESHPDEQVERWVKRFGEEKTEALCKWDNTSANVTVCTVPGGPTVAELVSTFNAAGVTAEPAEAAPSYAVIVPHGSHVDQLPGFEEGAFAVQDPATLGAVELLDVAPGMRVLDACSAPGGKTVQVALRMCGDGYVLAADCWADRLDPLRENLARFGLSDFVEVRQLDARRVSLQDVEERFDRILLDVPCSNTGVQRRRADAKWRFTPDRLKELNDTQYAILSNAAKLLQPGGKLVYSTCSLEKEENDDIVRKFLKEHPEFTRGEVRFSMPAVSGMDGAYAACLILDPNYKHPKAEKRSASRDERDFSRGKPSRGGSFGRPAAKGCSRDDGAKPFAKRGDKRDFSKPAFEKPFAQKRKEFDSPRRNNFDAAPRDAKSEKPRKEKRFDPRPQAAPVAERSAPAAKKARPTTGDTRW